jgi:hypothetical protein
MAQKPMPWAVKVILIIQFLMLFHILSMALNVATGLLGPFYGHRVFGHMFESPFYTFIFILLTFTLVVSIFGFLRARPYGRSITLVFYGFLILYVGGLLLYPFMADSLRFHRFSIYIQLVELCIFIFAFYLSLRPDVYNYCQSSDSAV